MLKTSKGLIVPLIFLIPTMILFLLVIYFGHVLFEWEVNYYFFEYCFIAFKELSNGYIFVPFILLSLIVHAIFTALWHTSKQMILLKKFKSSVTSYQIDHLTRRINKMHNCSNPIMVVTSTKPFAFTMGFLKPRIVLSSELISVLNEQELQAVILHEKYHQKNYDPLKCFLLLLLAKVMWYIPVMKELFHNYKILVELHADKYSIETTGSSFHLGKALLKLVNADTTESPGFVVHFGNAPIDYRISQLIDPSRFLPYKINLKSLFISLMGVSSMTILVFSGCI